MLLCRKHSSIISEVVFQQMFSLTHFPHQQEKVCVSPHHDVLSFQLWLPSADHWQKNINNCCKPYFSFSSHIQHDDAFLMEYNRYESRTLSWYLGHYLMSCSCYLIFCLRILALAYVISLESIQPATSPWHSKSNCFQFLVGWHHFLLHIRYTCWYVLQWE